MDPSINLGFKSILKKNYRIVVFKRILSKIGIPKIDNEKKSGKSGIDFYGQKITPWIELSSIFLYYHYSGHFHIYLNF